MAKKKETKKKKTVEKVEKKKNNIWIYIVLAIIVFIAMALALCRAGIVGITINNALSFLFGQLYIIPIFTILFFIVKWTIIKDKLKLSYRFYIGIILLNISLFLLDTILLNQNGPTEFNALYGPILSELKNITKFDCDFGAGTIGIALYSILVRYLTKIGAYIFLAISSILSLALLFGKPIKKIANKVKDIMVEDEKEAKTKEKHKRKKENIKQREKDRKVIEQLSKADETPEDKKEEHSEFFISADSETEKHKEETIPKEENHVQQKIINDHDEVRVLKRVPSFKGYKLPTSKDVLLLGGEKKNSEKNDLSAKSRGRMLVDVLATFGIKTKLEQIHIGPSVTKFEIKPESNVNLSKISSLSDNIKMELAAKTIRIEAPIPGRNAVGIEVPNVENVCVRMSELITKVPTKLKNNKLVFALGKDIMGTPVFCQLNKMPHLLIAGATGSGKSVCINTIITSYLLRTKPDEVKLVLVDPKKVEFTPYRDIPHLLWPVITDAKEASLMLQKIVAIMEERFDAFSSSGVRDITSFNEKVIEHNNNLKEGEEKMSQLPYIVVIIDELADLMTVANKEVEASIQRITQLARASGIHLIVATQRPSTDVITGLIKSNIPSRISFAVASSIDSRTILDSTGAEKLLGNGDMLYAPQGETGQIRLQGCFVTDKEIESITNYVKKQAKPEYDDTYFKLKDNGSVSGGNNAAEDDPLYDEVVEFVRMKQGASTSMLQRRFGIGYNRSARIIDSLEENGLIGPSNGSKPREVYIKKDDK